MSLQYNDWILRLLTLFIFRLPIRPNVCEDSIICNSAKVPSSGRREHPSRCLHQSENRHNDEGCEWVPNRVGEKSA